MHLSVVLVVAGILLSLSDGIALRSECSSECESWSDFANADMPHVARPCCPNYNENSDGSCPISADNWESSIGKCASYCPAQVYYEWGQEVYFTDVNEVYPDAVQAANPKGHGFSLPARMKLVWKAQQDLGGVNSKAALHDGMIGGFNDEGMLIDSGSASIEDIVVPQDGDNTFIGIGGYWTFIPLMKVTCGTYTETEQTISADRCASKALTTIHNVCIQEPVRDPDDSHKAIGISQLIDVKCHRPSRDYPFNCDNDAPAPHDSPAYNFANVAIPPGHIRSGFQKYQYHDATPLNHKKHKSAAKGTIDFISPSATDCLQAASDFYTPLYSGNSNPLTTGWRDNVCINQDPDDEKKCAVIGQYGT